MAEIVQQLDLIGEWRTMYGIPVRVRHGCKRRIEKAKIVAEDWDVYAPEWDDAWGRCPTVHRHRSGWRVRPLPESAVGRPFFLVTPHGLPCVSHMGIAWMANNQARREVERLFAGTTELREQEGECRACGAEAVRSHLRQDSTIWPTPFACIRCAVWDLSRVDR